MGLKRIRVDSIAEQKKTNADLQKENEELKVKVTRLENELNSKTSATGKSKSKDAR